MGEPDMAEVSMAEVTVAGVKVAGVSMASQTQSQSQRAPRAPLTLDRSAEGERCCPSVTTAPLGEADAADLARVLAALADPVRLRLLSLVASSAEVCSCELEGPLAKSQSTISHHTKVLADAGLIVGQKRGRWMWWHVETGRLAAVRTALGG